MSSIPNFLRSLLLTSFFSFVAPVFLVAGVLISFFLIGYVPGLTAIGPAVSGQILGFLATFGDGCPLQGVMVIGCTCSFVGALFDTYAFYNYQSLGGH